MFLAAFSGNYFHKRERMDSVMQAISIFMLEQVHISRWYPIRGPVRLRLQRLADAVMIFVNGTLFALDVLIELIFVLSKDPRWNDVERNFQQLVALFYNVTPYLLPPNTVQLPPDCGFPSADRWLVETCRHYLMKTVLHLEQHDGATIAYQIVHPPAARLAAPRLAQNLRFKEYEIRREKERGKQHGMKLSFAVAKHVVARLIEIAA